MNKIVIYTSIFGKYDTLPDITYHPPGCDFICFTDSNIQASGWEVIKVLPLYSDHTRNAKRYKILPHRYLKDYEISIYMDGNFSIIKDINELINLYLTDTTAAFHDHDKNALDSRNCIYQEAEAILWFGERNIKVTPDRGVLNFKDNPEIIKKQIKRYITNCYPKDMGLIVGGIILRRHNEKECIHTMENWWSEIKYYSKRDQLSFNYIAWKTNFKFNYIPHDTRNSEYFLYTKHNHQK
jgi:hypothetical protein